MKLYTMPFAGGSSYSYNQWADYINPQIQIVSIDYLGHGKRLGRGFDTDLKETISDMVKTILIDNSSNETFAIYGHSMGGIIAYQTSLVLQKEHGMIPKVTFIGACRPPHIFNYGERRNISSEFIIKSLINAKRLTPELAESREFRRFIYPIVENDSRLISKYKFDEYNNDKIHNPLICLWGDKDIGLTYENIKGWSQYSKHEVKFIKIEGEHFFVEDCAKGVCDVINNILIDN